MRALLKISINSQPMGILMVGIFILCGVAAFAQPTQQGEDIPDVTVVMEKERVIILPTANRSFEKIPPKPSEPIKPPITYTFQAFNFTAPQISPAIKPLKLKQPASSDIYGNYVRVGYGNYASPLLEAYLNSRKDKNKLLGAHFYHHSSAKGPVDGKNSSSGMTGVSLSGRSVGEQLSLGGNVSFENRATTFYGYPEGLDVKKDTIKQSYNLFKLNGELSNSKNSDFGYQLGAGFSYLSDKFTARETEIDLDFKSSYEMDEDSKINLTAVFNGITRKDDKVDAKPRTLFSVTPSYAFQPIPDLNLSVGLNIAFENDTVESKNLHVYPDVKASYPMSPSVDFVAHLSGGMETVSLQTLSNENLWLAQNIAIYHANNAIDFGFGLNARLGNKVGAYAGLSLKSYKKLFYFINAPDDQSKFEVWYDNTKQTNLYVALSYAQSETAKFLLRGDYFAYDVDDLPAAIHRPTYKLTANGMINVYDKLIFSADVIAQGGMKALELTETDGFKTVNLKGAFDLNFKTEYLFSKSFSAFIQLNNILSNKYPIFYHYPVRGFQATAGITWSF
jgi:hypothetical protein